MKILDISDNNISDNNISVQGVKAKLMHSGEI